MATVIDVTGKVCPYPVVVALDKLREISKKGGTLEIITDEPLATRSVPDEAKRLGFRATVERVDKGWKIVIKK